MQNLASECNSLYLMTKSNPIALTPHPHRQRAPLRHRGSEARGITSSAKCAALVRLAYALSSGSSLSHFAVVIYF